MKVIYVEIAPRDVFTEDGPQLLKQHYPTAEVLVPSLPADPIDALNELTRLRKEEKPDVVIGIGIGGTLVQALYGQYRIIVNPIFVLPQIIGEVCMSCSTGKRQVLFTPKQQDTIHQWLKQQFRYIPKGEEQYIYGLFAHKDNFLLYCETFFKQNYKYNFHYYGTGKLTSNIWEDDIVPLMQMLSDQIKGVKKPIVYIDMDNVLVDFDSGRSTVSPEEKAQYGEHIEAIPHYYHRLKPKEGAVEAFKKLSRHYDLYILSTAPWNNKTAWYDKIRWVKRYLGIYGYKRLILTHRKDLNQGDIIIDDRGRNGVAQFEGTWLQFGKAPVANWKDTVDYLLSGKEIVSNGEPKADDKLPEDDRPILYLDMDSVLVDFAGAVKNKLTPEETEKYRDHYDDVPDIFSRMEPVEGAVEAFKYLSEHFNTYILSTAPWDNNNAWCDKLSWAKKYLGKEITKRIVLSHHKDLNKGSYLIDDSSRNGAKEFCGKWFQFGKAPYENWKKMLECMKKAKDTTN